MERGRSRWDGGASYVDLMNILFILLEYEKYVFYFFCVRMFLEGSKFSTSESTT